MQVKCDISATRLAIMKKFTDLVSDMEYCTVYFTVADNFYVTSHDICNLFSNHHDVLNKSAFDGYVRYVLIKVIPIKLIVLYLLHHL